MNAIYNGIYNLDNLTVGFRKDGLIALETATGYIELTRSQFANLIELDEYH